MKNIITLFTIILSIQSFSSELRIANSSSIFSDGCGEIIKASPDLRKFYGKSLYEYDSKGKLVSYKVLGINLNLGIHSSRRYSSCTGLLLNTISEADGSVRNIIIQTFAPSIPSFNRIRALLKRDGIFLNGYSEEINLIEAMDILNESKYEEASW